MNDQQQTTESLTPEANYRRLYESMKDAFVSVTMDGRIQEYNEAYRQMLGYEPEELASLTFRDLTPSKWHAFQNELIQQQVLARGYSDTYEKEYRRKDGTLVPVELRTILLKDDDGQPCGMWAIVHDITARKKAELSLAEAERMLRMLMDASPESILLLDPAGKVLSANKTAAHRLGKSVNDVLGCSAYDLLPAEVAANRRTHVEKVVCTGQAVRFEDRRLGRYMEHALYPILDEHGRVTSVAVLGIDPTERNPLRLAAAITDISESPGWIETGSERISVICSKKECAGTSATAVCAATEQRSMPRSRRPSSAMLRGTPKP